MRDERGRTGGRTVRRIPPAAAALLTLAALAAPSAAQAAGRTLGGVPCAEPPVTHCAGACTAVELGKMMVSAPGGKVRQAR